MMWRIDREALLLMGMGRALLLQLAHPLIAAGVADHSTVREDSFGRLFRTLNTIYTIVFADIDSAMAAVQRMDAVHRQVRGRIRESVGAFAVGTPYDATDPALRLWVHATLVDTALLVYDHFIARLSAAEQAEYYADSWVLVRPFGIPEQITPPTLDEFRRYMAAMLASDRIVVGDTARALAHTIFHPSPALKIRAIGALLKFVTVGLLPPGVRQLYGYHWSPMREQAFWVFAGAIRRALPVVPSTIRVIPHARAAEAQLRPTALVRQESHPSPERRLTRH
jgi:uncharacterized protein (DUF2236 family)